MGYKQQQDTHYMNKISMVTLSKNQMFHDERKHIDTRNHFTRECIMKKDVQLKFAKSHNPIANIFTKLPSLFEDFRRLRLLIGVTNLVYRAMLEIKLDLKTSKI